MPYLLLILLVPLVEIWVFIQVGEVIGGGWTLLAIFATAVVGLAIIRQQGFGVLLRARHKMEQEEAPILEMLEGVLLAVAGVLLVVPGFVSDILGFLLLTPLRGALVKSLSGRMEMRRAEFRSTHFEGNVYEGEFRSSESPRQPLEKK